MAYVCLCGRRILEYLLKLNCNSYLIGLKMPRNTDGAIGGAAGGAEKQFCNKPGWQSSEKILLNGGVTFNVRVSYRL